MSTPSKAEQESPATPSLAHREMAPRWDKINSLLGGTEAMREAGTKYLPQHFREFDDDYNERLECSILFNVFELTVDALSGKPFTEPLVLEDDVPEVIRTDYAEDIDLQGNHIDQFSAMVFRDGLSKGLTHILVDTPAIEPGQTRTLADERSAGIRPYMVHVQPENVLAADAIRIEGREVLTHVRLYEAETERLGFAEVVVEYIRVFDLAVADDGKLFVQMTRYKKEKRKRGGKPQWVPQGTVDTDHDHIPLHTFYANRKSFMTSKPPLMDLADMNILHWQSFSDQINVLKVARFPILAASGVEDDGQSETTLGPRNVLHLEAPESRYYYVEHQGAAIEAGRKSLEELVDQMALYGATLLRRRPDRETATSRSIEEKEQTAPLQKMALAFKDTLENALKTMANLIGQEDGGSVKIHTDFGFDGGDVVDLQTLQVAYKDFAISRETFQRELVRRGILSEEFDAATDLTALKKEIEERIGAILSAPTSAVDEPEEDANGGEPQPEPEPEPIEEE